MTRLLGLVGVLALALASFGAQRGVAEPSTEGWGYVLADELMSPFCPGRALSECPSGQAEDLREWILEQERAGVPQAEVEAELFRQYGDQLRQAPRPEGVGLIAYGIPLLVFVAGAALVVLLLRRWSASDRGSAASPAPRPLDPELERLVEEELRRGEEAP